MKNSKKFFRYPNLLSILLILIICCLILSGCSQQDCINDQKTGEITSGEPSGLQDGTYILTAQYYDHWGYYQELDVTVCSGLITKVNLSEISVDGIRKTDGETWPKKETDFYLSEIYHLFAKQIIENQDAKVDAVSGATKTSSDFKTLAESFMTQAKNGQTGRTMICIGDTYTAESDFQSNIHSTLSISFDNENKMTDAVFSENINDINRSSNAPYRQLYSEMCEKTIALNSLAPLTQDPNYPEEYNRYNTLLTVIEQQRNGIK